MPIAPAMMGREARVVEGEFMVEVVRGVAAAVLRQAPQDVDPRRDLFEQGMSSIVALELVARLEKRLGRPLPQTLVLDHPTVDRMARALAPPEPAPVPEAAPRAAAPAADVAVVGFGVRLPGATSPDAWWRARLAGERWLGLPPESRGAPVRRVAGWLDDVATFDNDRFGITDRECGSLDPLHRLLLEAAADALDAGGLQPLRRRTGVWLGVPDGPGRSDRWTDAYGGTGSETSFTAGRVAWALDLGGPALALNTACSASLVAIHQAVGAIRAGQVDAALAGGGSLLDGPGFAVLDALGALSADGQCRAFSTEAAGYARGEGVVVVALARADVAAARGMPVIARILASAVNHGGRTPGVTVPDAGAQAAVIRAAVAEAGVDLDLVQAHGTGTPLGDPIELRGLRSALPEGRARYLVSAKTAVGHLEQGAGAVGVLEAALALRDQVVPPHHHGGAAPGFELPAVATPATLRAAGVSAFGISGTNAHLVLAAPGAPERRAPSTRPAIALVSAPDEAGLQAAAARLAEAGPTADMAASSRQLRHDRHRLAVVAGSAPELADRLARGPWIRGRARSRPRVALVFPGAGAQRAGGGRGLYASEPVFRATIDRCAAVDGSLLPMLLDPAGARIDGIAGMQVAVTAVALALADLWRSVGLDVGGVIGHSFGEIAAAAFCGVLTPEDAMRLAAARGRRMAAVPPNGGMAVVFAGADVVGPLLGERCWIAGHHGPGETVISGDVADAATRLGGLDVRPITVDNAYHSPRVEPAARAFEADLAGFNFGRARLPAWGSNGARVEHLWQEPRYWRDHLVAPVRLADALAAAHADGVECLVEVGARAVVLSTAGRQPDPIPVLVPSLRKDLPEREAWAVAAAELLVAGVDLPDLDPPAARVALPPRPRVGRTFAPPAPAPRRSAVAPTLGAVRWTALPAGLERTAGTWLVLGDRGGVGDRVATALGERGLTARLVVGAQPASGAWDAVLDLRGLDVEPTPAGWRGRADQLRQLARQLAAQPARLWMVTRCGQEVTAGDPVDPGQALAWGLVRTLAAELPAADPTLLDVGPLTADGVARDVLLALAWRRDRERQLAVRGGQRYVARWGTSRRGSAPPIRGDRAYLVVGGTGALGQHLAGWLTERGAGSVWRSGRRTGVDASDPAAVDELLGEIDAAGLPLAGVFVLSAVLADGLLASQPASAVDAVLKPKIDVAWNLHRATLERPLDLFVTYSSAAGVLPSVGQALYGAGNAFQDGLAAHRRALGLPGVSLCWGPWAEIGLASALGPAHRARQEAAGIRFHRPEDASAALDAALGAPDAAVVLADVDWPAHLASLGDPGPFYATVARPVAPEAREPLAAVPDRDPAAALAMLEAGLRDVIGCPPDRALDPDALLPELGVDSLMAVRLHARIQEAGYTITVGRVLSGPSIRQLAAELAEPPEAPTTTTTTTTPPSTTTALVVSAALGLLAGALLMGLAWSVTGAADASVGQATVALPPPPP